jgi:hypothetical protein
MPTGAEAANRATLPQLIIPGGAPGNATPAPPAGADAAGQPGTDAGTRKNTEGTR